MTPRGVLAARLPFQACMTSEPAWRAFAASALVRIPLADVFWPVDFDSVGWHRG